MARSTSTIVSATVLMKRASSLAAILLVYVCCLTFAMPAQAEESVKQKSPLPVILLHTPPRASELPPPGFPITLTVRLKNTRDSERRLRAFAVRDGKLFEMMAPSGRFNEREEIAYQLPVNAPMVELSYQFVLYNPDGSLTSSPRFTVRRSCLPSVDLTPIDQADAVKGDAKISALISESKGLERDIQQYERVLSLIDDLKGLIKE